ncbi:recombinase family protein [Pseudoxanthomonas winnipegensis]|uniref:Recombinase family protein n=1 Tax=Pseudoxanthomonas winnipegensis TaxID=2480810 RepID=A0A4Q8L7Y8_9GAMM|nr:recombinase family protein [Pseudoxanthomonas winnipegensis]
MKIAAYARYSSDQQSSASLDDQLRNCRAYCQRMAWPDPVAYTDAAMSGARNDRPGYRKLLADAHLFDVILLDDLTRLSRDSVEVQQQVRRLKFSGVRVIAVSDAIDTADKAHKLGVGLRGLMGELYLDDLRDKTHRGLTGRALSGASAGGLAYGYRVTTTGQRAIDPEQAAAVRRIFAEYLAGSSPREIAAGLTRDDVPSARGGTWAMTAIYGDKRRGIGILSNPIYAGRQVWNRSRWIKHPDTGRRVRQERPESEWVITEHPELAIIDERTWDAAQARLRGSRRQVSAGRRAQHLLSGIMRCHACGGPLVVIDRRSYACNIHKDRGDAACPSRLRVPRADAERALLAGIREQLLSDAAFQRVQRVVQATLKTAAPDTAAISRRLAAARQVHANVMTALRAGIITASTKAELERAESEIRDIEAELTAAKAYQPSQIVPRLREVWQRTVGALAEHARNLPAAREALRALLGQVVVRENENGDLVAEIAASSVATAPEQKAQIFVVAGAGFEPATFGL